MPEHCTCLLRNLYADQEATEQDMEQWTGSKLGKEYVKAVCCHPAYSTNMQTTSCKILSWTNHKVELRWLEEITTSDVQMADILVAESEEQLRSLLMKVREESEKPGLKLNNQKKKKKIMASYPITSWQKDGAKVDTVADFIFLIFKITVHNDSSHEIKSACSLEEKL